MNLRNKINLYTSVLFAILLLAINVIVYFSFSKLTLATELNTAQKEMEKISKEIGKSLGIVPENELLRSYVPINGMIQIITTDNNRMTTVTSPSEQKLSERKVKFYKGEVNHFIDYHARKYAFESSPIILPDGNVANLQITKNIQSVIVNLHNLRLVLISVTLLVLIPVLISSRLLSKLITMPVISLIRTMSQIQQSGHFKRLTIKGKSKDELYQMGETFNHMINLLESNFDKQKQFVSNASHELKTPLTIIESYASLLKRRGQSDAELFSECVNAIHSEAIRMKELTEQLLMLAKHTEQWNIQTSSVDLSIFLQGMVRALMSAYHREIKLVEKKGDRVTVVTDEQKLKQLLFIFLDNSRKYSEGVITVLLGNQEGKAYIKIIDRGIGIPPDELPNVFERFYRVDQARNRKNGGSGLGLSLAKEIADAIGVCIKLESEEGIGTTVTLYLNNI